jgi:ubiquinone/menaquinone biosynthesis C-methylase UbiE
LVLSPDFVYKDVREIARENNPNAELIAGLGQALPFRNESFDMVFAVHVIDHIESIEDLLQLLSEAARTIKRGGRAYIGPVCLDVRVELRKNKKFTEDLRAEGIKILEGQVPEEYGHERLYGESGMHEGDAPYTTIILEKNQESSAPQSS